MKGLDTSMLLQYEAQEKSFNKGDIIILEDSMPRYYYQLIKGCIRVSSQTEDAKSFTQGIFTDGQSFGEPPLIIKQPYPASAIAVTSGTLLRLPVQQFDKMLKEHPEICHQLNLLLAGRIYEKTKRNKILTNQSPASRILFILDEMKKKQGSDKYTKELILLTRQEIADFTGLRVETVIRTIKKMEADHKIEIRNRKLYY